MRLLIVDDEYDIVDLITEECQSCGISVDVAYDGQRAQELIIENNNYDFVLTDLNMPQLSGVELIHWLRSDTDRTTKIIVMTASVEIHPDLNLQWVDHLILKPFAMPELMALLRQLHRHDDPSQRD